MLEDLLSGRTVTEAHFLHVLLQVLWLGGIGLTVLWGSFCASKPRSKQ